MKALRNLINKEVKRALNETYRDPKENVAILHGMLKKGGKDAKRAKDIIKGIKDELSVIMSTTDPKANLKLVNKVTELDEYLDDAIEMALDDGMGRFKGMMGGMSGVREVSTDTVYQYNFILSRGISADGSDETTTQAMMNDIKEWWDEQGPKGYDIMQIYATANTETKDPAVVVELEEALVLYTKVQLNEPVAMSTAKKASSGKIIQPTQVVNTLNISKMTETKAIIKRLKEDTAYQEFFKKAMAKFKISTPADLKDPVRKKEFFDYIDKNYKADNEVTESIKKRKK